MSKKFLVAVVVIILAAGVAGLIFRMITSHDGSPGILASTDGPASFLDKAGKLASQGSYDEAVKYIEMIIGKYPDAPQVEGAYFLLGSIYEKQGDLFKAKDIYQKMTERFPASGSISKIQNALEDLNVRILFSSVMTPDSFSYVVEKGDALNKIAKKFDTTAELIARQNNIKDGVLRIGKRLKITNAKFSIIVDKSQNILTLKSNGEILKAYRVSTGKNSCTPVGTFKITNKVVDPPWYPSTGGVIPSGDVKNVLGSRWLGISKPGYGIHGTTQPEAIGKSVTDGCIRLRNQDVEELYAIVPEGTEVVIVD